MIIHREIHQPFLSDCFGKIEPNLTACWTYRFFLNYRIYKAFPIPFRRVSLEACQEKLYWPRSVKKSPIVVVHGHNKNKASTITEDGQKECFLRPIYFLKISICFVVVLNILFFWMVITNFALNSDSIAFPQWLEWEISMRFWAFKEFQIIRNSCIFCKNAQNTDYKMQLK